MLLVVVTVMVVSARVGTEGAVVTMDMMIQYDHSCCAGVQC